MVDEIPFPPLGFTAVLVFDDPTPNTVILKRPLSYRWRSRRSALT
jgi:hypothetical protein